MAVSPGFSTSVPVLSVSSVSVSMSIPVIVPFVRSKVAGSRDDGWTCYDEGHVGKGSSSSPTHYVLRTTTLYDYHSHVPPLLLRFFASSLLPFCTR